MTNISEARHSTCQRCGLDFVQPENVRLVFCQVCDAELIQRGMSESETVYLYVTLDNNRNVKYISNWLGSLKFWSHKIVKRTNFTHTVYYGERKSKWTIRAQRNITIEFTDGNNQRWRGTLFNLDWNMCAKFRKI